MKTSIITVSLYGDEQNVERICGYYKGDFEIKQHATYEVVDGLATIHSLTPTFKAQVNLPFPFVLGVTDLGSGTLDRIDINCNTLQAHVAICRSAKWAERHAQRPPLSTHQQLIADYCSLT